ncbi:hypothetical protein AAEO57_09840 [Flavobacterium sp. DGU38]|uniref:5-methylcytosine-specific restriction enzyme subunit McrC n=1 Tax=Flavobacterium calami TaxID=3139144 RepID=A0ABU9INW8_9FLAO
MGEFDFNKDSFKQFLKQKESQIHLRTDNGIQDTDNFKNLHRSLVSYHSERPIGDFTAIIITKNEIENLISDFSVKLFEKLDSQIGVCNNHLLFDRNLEILSYHRKELKDNNDARKFYLELSRETCVFLISPKGVHYFIDGNDIGESIFFTSDALKSYNELKDITNILDILNDYRIHLKHQDIYSKFFVSNSSKRSLCKHLNSSATDTTYKDFLVQHVQLLENKPEHRFREDLRMYLTRNLKANVLGKEYILENFKRLDIFINDDFGELYLIEVKWVGVSIHPKGQQIGTSYNANNINPDAITQSVDYIRQFNEEGKNIKLGYLAVFDARKDDLPDTVFTFDKTQLKIGSEKYFPRFVKIPDFRVVNFHPL